MAVLRTGAKLVQNFLLNQILDLLVNHLLGWLTHDVFSDLLGWVVLQHLDQIVLGHLLVGVKDLVQLAVFDLRRLHALGLLDLPQELLASALVAAQALGHLIHCRVERGSFGWRCSTLLGDLDQT